MVGEFSRGGSALVTGVLFGALFPLVGTLLVMGLEGLGFSVGAAVAAQAGEPLLWIVDLAPFVLGAVGARHDARGRELEALRARATAQQVEEEVDRFLTVAIDPLAISDFDGAFRRISPGFTRVLGYTLGDLEGLTLSDLVHPEERPQFERWLKELEAEGAEPRQSRMRLRTVGDEYRWLDWSTMPIREQRLFYAQGRDVTAEVESTAELVRAREAAEASSRAKSEFLANISHELRTPMNGIMGMTALTLDTELSKQQRSFLEAVSRSAHRLFGIIEDLLDFSHLETDRLPMVTEPFDVEAVVGTVIDRMRGRAEAKGLRLRTEIVGAPGPVVGAGARVSQVLGQLVDNAIKFTERGSVTVRVEQVLDADGAVTLSFEVVDTGIGFDEREKSRIFEAFSQADNSLSRSHGGTGLGLSVASRLVELMGGRLDAEGVPGKGSVFRFELTLPLAEAEDSPSATASESGSEEKVRGPLFVLLVDDNRVNRVLTEALLTRRGFTVTVAPGGSEAVDFFRTSTFDAVLMDVEMPGMHGIEATRAMRRIERERLRRTPIIALTAHSSRADRERCMQAGMDDYLTMPADGDALDRIIRRHAEGGPTDFERTRALELAAGDPNAVAAAASDLLATGRDELVSLRQAVDRRDVQTIARSAEHLEGLAEGVSANRLRDIAHTVAVLARTGRGDEAAALLAEVDEAYRRGAEVVARGVVA